MKGKKEIPPQLKTFSFLSPFCSVLWERRESAAKQRHDQHKESLIFCFGPWRRPLYSTFVLHNYVFTEVIFLFMLFLKLFYPPRSFWSFNKSWSRKSCSPAEVHVCIKALVWHISPFRSWADGEKELLLMMTAGYMNRFVLVTSLGPLSSVIRCYHHAENHFCQMSWIFVSQGNVRAGVRR